MKDDALGLEEKVTISFSGPQGEVTVELDGEAVADWLTGAVASRDATITSRLCDITSITLASMATWAGGYRILPRPTPAAFIDKLMKMAATGGNEAELARHISVQRQSSVPSIFLEAFGEDI